MKDNFFKSTFILLVGGVITKILGIITRIVLSRTISSDVLGLYMMIIPSFMLLLCLSQFGMPIALSKLVAENNKNNKVLFSSILITTLLVNVLLIFCVIIFAPIIASNLLHNSDLKIGLIAMGLVIPFTSISSICRSYFFGKENMLPHIISNFFEDISRIVIYLIFLPKISNLSNTYIILFLIITNIICEIISIFILLLFMPRNFSLKNIEFKPNIQYIKDSLSIGIPNTTGRLFGSIGHFFEPIVLSTTLISLGYSVTYITKEYGIISGYVMPVLLIPSFFTMAISQAILPVITKSYAKKDLYSVSKYLKLAIFLSFTIGSICMMFTYIFSKDIFNILYKNNLGINYLKVLAPFCILQYIQAPLSSFFDATNNSKIVMYGSIIGVLFRIVVLYFIKYFNIGIWGLVISIIVNIIIITFYYLYKAIIFLKCFNFSR